ncbi:MAG: hypothetical protein AAFY28_13240 [Actinomycetota bacterium]
MTDDATPDDQRNDAPDAAQPDAASRDELASAYLDGELDDDATSSVEADDDTMRAVRAMTSAKALLADTDPAPISMRERHLAAALDAWERLPEPERLGARRDSTPAGVDGAAAAGAAAVTAPPTPMRRRRTRNNAAWLTAAAAALVLVLAGGLIVQTVTDDRDDSDDSSDIATGDVTSDTLPATDAQTRTVAPSATAESFDASGEVFTEEADDQAVAADTESTVSDGSPADEAEDAGEASGALELGPDDRGPPPDTDLEVLNTPDDVALFAAAAVDAPTAPDIEDDTSASDDAAVDTDADADTDAGAGAQPEDALPELAAEPLCGAVDVVVGRAFYAGQLAIIGVDNAADVAYAHLPETCVELVRAALP